MRELGLEVTIDYDDQELLVVYNVFDGDLDIEEIWHEGLLLNDLISKSSHDWIVQKVFDHYMKD